LADGNIEARNSVRGLFVRLDNSGRRSGQGENKLREAMCDEALMCPPENHVARNQILLKTNTKIFTT